LNAGDPVALFERASTHAANVTGQKATLEPELVETCIALFLPDMPERGRASGLVGPAVHVPDDASPQDRLLAAMGRRP
jgi:hypothetical protein